MRLKPLALRYIIPAILAIYTTIMVLIQLGIPNKTGLLQNINNMPDFEMDGFLGQQWIFHYQRLQGNYVDRSKTFIREDSVPDSEKLTYFKKKNNFKKIGSIYVFSAFLDDRPSIVETVRIIALKKSLSLENLICHFRMRDRRVVNVTAYSYEMCENHGRLYGGWMYFCKVPTPVLEENQRKHINLQYISVSSTDSNNVTKIKLSASTTNYTNKILQDSSRGQIGLCIPPLFGDISISLLIQFMELSKLLGVSHFTFYINEISESIYKILRFYHLKREVTLINWKLPDNIMNKEIWYHGQLLTIQDCLYRNMANYEYLAFLDLDEFIIPKSNYTFLEMIDYLRVLHNDTKSFANIDAFSFKSAFFAPNQVPDPSQHLTFLQLLQRNTKLSSKRTKMIVRPERILELGIHHVSKSIGENMTVMDVDPERAKIHHYRACAVNYEPEMTCYVETRDDTILKYGSDLVQNYKNTIKKTLPLFMPKHGT